MYPCVDPAICCTVGAMPGGAGHLVLCSLGADPLWRSACIWPGMSAQQFGH
jgi:hypothetical protein